MNVKEINLKLNEEEISEKLLIMVNELREKGFDEIQLTVKGSIEELIKKAGFSTEVFKRIKNEQDLPDWVVYDLIESTGKLKNTDFSKRLRNAD
jgi:hypothetical protein